MNDNTKTLADAFSELISKRGWYKNSGVVRRIAYRDKLYFQNGTLLEQKMRDYLEKAGYKLYQPEMWIKE